MESDVGDMIIGLVMLAFGLIGLFLASGATDIEMSVFGFSLAAFAVCFGFGLIRRHFDRRDAILATARKRTDV